MKHKRIKTLTGVTVLADALTSMVWDKELKIYRDPDEGLTVSASQSEVRTLKAFCKITKDNTAKQFIMFLLHDLERGYDQLLKTYFTRGDVTFSLTKDKYNRMLKTYT